MKIKILLLITTMLLSHSLLMGKTLVTVNGHKIDDSIAPKGYQQLDEEKRAIFMEQLIKEELIHAYLLKSDIVQDAKFKTLFNKQKELEKKEYKKIYGKELTKDQIRNIKGSLALMVYQKKQFQSITIDDAKVKEFYDNNPERFNFPNSIEIANIIVKTEQEAKNIIKKLKGSSIETFIKTAQEHKQRGYMGWFKEGTAPENIFNAAYKSKAKTLIKKPIQTEHGYHVIYLINKKAAGKLSYKEAKETIEMMIKQKKSFQQLREKVENLYGNAEIVY